MQLSDKVNFMAGLTKLGQACNRRLDPDQQELYWRALEQHPWNVVRQGLWAAIREWRAGGGRKALPMPGDLRPYIEAAARQAAHTRPSRASLEGRTESWKYVCEGCKDVGLVAVERGLYQVHRPCTCTAGEPWHARCRREGAWA